MRSVERRTSGEVVCGSIFRNDWQGAAREATFVADVSQGQVTPLEAHTETMRMRRDGDSIPNGEAIWVDLLGCEGTQAFIGLGTWHRATRLLDIQKEYTQMGFQKEYPGDLHCVNYSGLFKEGVWSGQWSSPSLGTNGSFVYHLDEASMQAHTEAGQREVPRKRLREVAKRTWKNNVFASNTGRRETLEAYETICEKQERGKLHRCMVPNCGAAFEKPSALKDHERTHTLEKPFGCKHCPQSFSRSSNLRRHERTHEGSKPFQCTYCSQLFNDTSNRQKHESRKHNVSNEVLILDGNMYVDSAPFLLFQVE
jgi:Zinc finger, C2H2 type